MKRSLFLNGLLLTLFLPIYAQNLAEPVPVLSAEERAVNITEEINKEVSLATEQKPAVLQTWKECFTDMEDIRQLGSARRSSLRKSLQELEQIRDVKMKGILDERQFTQYETFVKAIRPSGREIFRGEK